jgi:hypothetical protein
MTMYNLVHFVSRLQMLEYRTKPIRTHHCIKAILMEKLACRVLPRIPFQGLRRFNMHRVHGIGWGK